MVTISKLIAIIYFDMINKNWFIYLFLKIKQKVHKKDC